MMLSDVCLSVRLSVTYIGPKSRTERPRKTKIGTEVAHVTRDSDTIFKVKGQGHRGGAYCGGLPHSLLLPKYWLEWRCHRELFNGHCTCHWSHAVMLMSLTMVCQLSTGWPEQFFLQWLPKLCSSFVLEEQSMLVQQLLGMRSHRELISTLREPPDQTETLACLDSNGQSQHLCMKATMCQGTWMELYPFQSS